MAEQTNLAKLTTDRLVEATTGEFEVLERIGHGAMGSVYLARDVALSRRVAIKVISPHLLQDETMVARFRLEAQTVAALRHPHIVNLHAVRQVGDLHYFVMDFIDGPSLRTVLKAHAPLDLDVARSLLFQVGSALGYAHRRGRGVIHRDIKPANIMVDREGNAVVMDFGISKVGAARGGLTQTGATIGTPEYMSPEQCMDEELTGASDQYALGVVAYEMLTGSVPFKGSTYALMVAHAQEAPIPVAEARPDCPPEVGAAVMRMLAKTPGERFGDAEEAVAALGGAPLGPRDPVRSAIVALIGSVARATADLDESSPLSPVPPPRAADVPTVALPSAALSPPAAPVARPRRVEATPDPAPGRRGGARVGRWIGAAALVVVALGAARLVGGGFAAAPDALEATVGAEPTPVAADVGAGVTPEGPESPPDGAEIPDPPVPSTAVSSAPAVRSVMIDVGARALRAGATVPVSAAAVGAGGGVVTDVAIRWASTDADVASVRDGTIVAGRAGDAAISASAGDASASVDVRVLDLPTRSEVAALLQQGVVRAMATRDGDANRRPGAVARPGRAALLERAREQNVQARLESVGEITPRGNGATVDFVVALAWRAVRGGRASRSESMRASLVPTADGWAVGEVSRPAG